MESKKYNKNGKYILVVCPNPSVDIFAWVDGLKIAGSNRVTKELHYPGGKGVHVAMAIAELGIEVKLLGFWGGPTGSWVKTECEKRYKNLKWIGLGLDGWTRSCYTFKSDSEVDETELLGMGPELTDDDLESFNKSFEDYLPDAICVTMSGSWPKGAPSNGYANLIARSNAQSKAVILDCSGDQLLNGLKLNPYAVHLNRSEVTSYTGLDDVEEASRKLSEITIAAITDGSKGLYLSENQNTIHASCIIDAVHSAVGSGDCLTAGLAVGFAKGLPQEEVAKLGVACGAANCLKEDLGMLNREDVDRLVEKVKVHNGHLINSNA